MNVLCFWTARLHISRLENFKAIVVWFKFQHHWAVTHIRIHHHCRRQICQKVTELRFRRACLKIRKVCVCVCGSNFVTYKPRCTPVLWNLPNILKCAWNCGRAGVRAVRRSSRVPIILTGSITISSAHQTPPLNITLMKFSYAFHYIYNVPYIRR